MNALDRIEAILADIERIDRESCGQFRQADDREAYDLVCQVERQLQRSPTKKSA